jgi:hypothetical protein
MNLRRDTTMGLRVWCAGGGAKDGGEEAVLSAGPLVPEDPAAGCTSVPRRHLDMPGSIPSCIST